MKLFKSIGLLFLAIVSANADLTSVTVESSMLHAPNSGAGVEGFCGTLQYSLAPEINDSVFVSISIAPVTGGNAIALSEVSGDVGSIRVNTNLPKKDRTYTIFFQSSDADPGVNYIAHLTAEASVTAKKTRVEELLSSLSKNQKATLCGGSSFMEGAGAGAVPAIYMSDGPHGIRVSSFGSGNSTCFPSCAGLCATWDTAQARRQGEGMGEEYRAYSRNCCLGPAGNIVYHPQGGRASEYFGEDAYLSGKMMAATVRGVQSKGVIATVKHYACNNREQNRHGMSSNMDERSIRELYLYAWKPSFVEAQTWGVMSAYNRVNNSYAGTNRYIMSTVMREEWGYKFLSMTDWGAGFDNLSSGMNWGVDIQMPSPSTYTVSGVSGFSDSIVDVHARRIILAHEMMGDMKSGYNRKAYESALMSAAHTQVARSGGEGGVVLARNKGNILPLPKTGAVIALTGPFRNQCRLGPGGTSSVTPPTASQINPLQGMQNCLSGVSGASTIQNNSTANADYIVVFVGVTGEREGGDRPSLEVTAEGDDAAGTALGITSAKTVVVFTGGSAASAGKWSDADAILIAFYPGQEQGNVIADVLFGNVNPSGKLPVTFPQNASQLPTMGNSSALNYPDSDEAHGYFRMNKNGETPLFAFGHGLSYTTFSFTNLQVYPQQITAGDRVFVRVTVTNTGSVAGKTVPQLYLSMPSGNSSLPVRVQDLRGFKKILLDPDESKTVDFQLTWEEMKVFDPNGADYNGSGFWTVLKGEYTVRVGASSDVEEEPTVSSSFTVQ